MTSLERIDFISSYCDRWCERCAFTLRCSAYAVEIATVMCDGDVKAGLELAVGSPPPENQADAARRAALLDDLAGYQPPTEEEIQRYAREEDARDERVDNSPITTSAIKLAILATDWLEAHREHALDGAVPAVKDGIEVAARDAHFIAAKLHCALRGRDEFRHGQGFDNDASVRRNQHAPVNSISQEIRRGTNRRPGDQELGPLIERGHSNGRRNAVDEYARSQRDAV